MILEEKLIEKKINKKMKKIKFFHWDCNMTKDIENVNKKWNTEMLGVKKDNDETCEKNKYFLESQRLTFSLIITIENH